MSSFVEATLLILDEGAEYQGQLWDRWVTLRCIADGRVIKVFDFDFVHLPLALFEDYECLIQVTILKNLHTPSLIDDSADSSWWQGLVVDSRWLLSESRNAFLGVSPHVYRDKTVLMQTSAGNMLMSLGEFAGTPQPGGSVSWEAVEFHLKGIRVRGRS